MTHLDSTHVSTTYLLYLHCSPLALYLVFSLDQQSVCWMTSTPCLTKELKRTKHLESRSKQKVPLACVSKDRHCLPARTRTAKLSLVPKSSWALLSLLACVFMHGLLPSCRAGTTASCPLTASCSHSHYSY